MNGALCTLLLAIAACVSGDGGAVSVFNNATYNPTLVVAYGRQSAPRPTYQEASLEPGANKTISIPEGMDRVEFGVVVPRPGSNFTLLAGLSSKPFEMCLKTSGTKDDPEVKIAKFKSADSRSATVVNSADYCVKFIVRYESKGAKTRHGKLTLMKGTTGIVLIPEIASDVEATLWYGNSTKDCEMRNDDKAKFNKLFNATVSGRDCYKLSGTYAEPKHTKIDCQSVFPNSRDLSSCTL